MTENRLYAVRGAVCAKNEPQSIKKAINLMFENLYAKNKIVEDDIVSIQFTITKDLTCLNPAKALRELGFCNSVPLFCSQEPQIDGMLESVIRVLITGYFNSKPSSFYGNGAEVLRPDLCS